MQVACRSMCHTPPRWWYNMTSWLNGISIGHRGQLGNPLAPIKTCIYVKTKTAWRCGAIMVSNWTSGFIKTVCTGVLCMHASAVDVLLRLCKWLLHHAIDHECGAYTHPVYWWMDVLEVLRLFIMEGLIYAGLNRNFMSFWVNWNVKGGERKKDVQYSTVRGSVNESSVWVGSVRTCQFILFIFFGDDSLEVLVGIFKKVKNILVHLNK